MKTLFETTLTKILNTIFENDAPQFPPSPQQYKSDDPIERPIDVPPGLTELRELLSQIASNSVVGRGRHSGQIRTWKQRPLDHRGLPKRRAIQGWWRTDYAEIMMRTIVGAGLGDIPVENMNAGVAMFGIDTMFINFRGFNSMARKIQRYHRDIGEYLLRIVTEYGHVLIDRQRGSRFNFWLQKDTQGNTISIQDAARYLADDHTQAEQWALQRLTPYTKIKLKRSAWRPSESMFIASLKLVAENCQTIEEVEQYFVSRGGPY